AGPKIRLQRSEDEDPFHPSRAIERPSSGTSDVVARAEQEFSNKHYRESRSLYEQAHQADPHATDACRERWAYCKLYYVVEQLNPPGATKPLPELEDEVRLAINLAPSLQYAKNVLAEVQKRRQGGPAVEAGKNDSAAASHAPQTADGWTVTESVNFR